MRNRSLIVTLAILSIAFVCGAVEMPSAHAEVITWNVGARTGGLGATEGYTANQILIVASGFDGNSQSTGLLGVSDGDGVSGLQIASSDSIQINFSNARAVGVTGFSFEMANVASSETWSVFGVDNDGIHLIMSGSDNTDHTLSGVADQYAFYSFRLADSNSTDVFLLETVDGVSSAVPEPLTWAMLLIGFAGIGLARWRHPKSAITGSTRQPIELLGYCYEKWWLA